MKVKKYSHSSQTLSRSEPVLCVVRPTSRASPSDLNHHNMYVVGLGLCTFANVASEEMSRDLANEVEKLLGSSNTYIRKKVCLLHRPNTNPHFCCHKAALCALRIIRKVPDLVDHFVSKAKSLLTDRNHGVLLATITLVSEMCQINENCLNEFRNVGSSLYSMFLLLTSL